MTCEDISLYNLNNRFNPNLGTDLFATPSALKYYMSRSKTNELTPCGFSTIDNAILHKEKSYLFNGKKYPISLTIDIDFICIDNIYGKELYFF